MSLRLENGVGCCYDGGSATTSPTSDVDTAPPVSPGHGDSTSRVCSKENLLGVSCRTMVLGQILSLLIAMMSISAASLDDRGISIPSFVNFVNYSFIMALFFFPMLFSWFQGSLQLTLPWWRYAFYALVDVEANTLAVLAYRYTSITSVAMLDAFSIPAVMILSRLLLRAQYNEKHMTGVGLCVVGLALTIVSDLQGDEADSGHPHAFKGDVLCILGATLYAGSNVMQEDFVKNYNRREFLGMAGLFGTVISGVQTLALEKQLLAEVEWTRSVVLFTFGYALSLSVLYSWTSLFLQAGDAAMFNLSLLTSDVYALLFSVLVEHATPHWLYFVAFVVIFCGLVVYHGQPPPTCAEPLPRLALVDGTPGSSWSREGDDCGGHKRGTGRAFFGMQRRECSGESAGTSSTATFCSSELSPGASVSPSPPAKNPWLDVASL
ncbi:conserved unknown protein [Ectocarpus siliculosus]|uniref:Uncharacterized protein n=1 Tax=Ectocarpus siliculosus TaxID=2880 RepID=D7FS78_ECTSI|nr:conserved unknown protein [Ectocarpus siliculosus]|eukprot:CBJ31019.1 conserved unknown protein [Ectocarpus siliculosus]